MNEQLQGLYAVGGFLLLWILWFCFWRRSVSEELRQNLFDLRHDLFVLAARNPNSDICFGSPAYEEFRKALNGLIRCAYEFDALAPVIYRFLRFLSGTAAAPDLSFKEKLLNVPEPHLRTQLQDLLGRFNRSIVRALLKGSPLFWIIAAAIMIEVFGKLIISRFRKGFDRPLLAMPHFVKVKAPIKEHLSPLFEAVWEESKEAELQESRLRSINSDRSKSASLVGCG